MELNDKIAHLRELFLTRDAIDEEIAQMLGGGEPEEGPKVKATKAPKVAKRGSKGKVRCNECKTTGSRHFKKCSQSTAGKKSSTAADGTDGALSRIEYKRVKDLKFDGRKTKDISELLDLNIREVNAAYSSSDYDNYIFEREA